MAQGIVSLMPNTLTRSHFFHLFLCFLVALSANGEGRAQSKYSHATPARIADASQISVIPQPKQLTVTPDAFRLTHDKHVAPADARSEDDVSAAEDFVDDLKATANVVLAIRSGSARHDILIGRLDLPQIHK